MATLNDRDREQVAVCAAIAAGCEPCTQHHVRAALESGLTTEELQKAIDTAHTIRGEAGNGLAGLGKRLLGLDEGNGVWEARPADRAEALTYIGAAAGCNAGVLLADNLRAGYELGLSEEELSAAVEAARVVKKGAAMFMDREVERALRPLAAVKTGGQSPGTDCGCGAECG